jgi:hypothetical protein
MIKIGILTYLKEYSNLGTNMQSYCTLKAIENAYPEAKVELIDYSGWKPAMKPYLSHVSLQSLKNDFVRIKKYKNFFRENLLLSKKKLISSNFDKSIKFIKNQNYDAIYVGSDTLLELKRALKNELTAYWLDKTIHSKKFLIAASSHNVVFEQLSDIQKNEMEQTINEFSLLGVRDEATYRLLSNFIPTGDKRLMMVPDPTFTFKIDYKKIEEYFHKKKLSFNKPIVCLHLLRNTEWASELANNFRKEGYIIASLRPAYYADIIFTDLSPFEQMGLYKYFDLVITHRFHDSIFCLKNLTPVIVFPEFPTDVTLHGDNKNKTLFKSFNIDNVNYIDTKENINAKYLFKIHKQAILNFKNEEDFIKIKLEENIMRYESYIMDTKRIVMQ